MWTNGNCFLTWVLYSNENTDLNFIKIQVSCFKQIGNKFISFARLLLWSPYELGRFSSAHVNLIASELKIASNCCMNIPIENHILLSQRSLVGIRISFIYRRIHDLTSAHVKAYKHSDPKTSVAAIRNKRHPRIIRNQKLDNKLYNYCVKLARSPVKMARAMRKHFSRIHKHWTFSFSHSPTKRKYQWNEIKFYQLH